MGYARDDRSKIDLTEDDTWTSPRVGLQIRRRRSRRRRGILGEAPRVFRELKNIGPRLVTCTIVYFDETRREMVSNDKKGGDDSGPFSTVVQKSLRAGIRSKIPGLRSQA